MKDLNKLLADFVGEEVAWDDLYEDWVFKGYSGYVVKYNLWKPDQNWNQLMQIIDKIKPMWKDEIYGYEISQFCDTPIGNSIIVIYEKLVTLVKLITNEQNI